MCDDCLEGTAAIGDFLIQDEEIEFQVLEFMTLLCTDEATFDTCVSNIVLVKKYLKHTRGQFFKTILLRASFFAQLFRSFFRRNIWETPNRETFFFFKEQSL